MGSIPITGRNKMTKSNKDIQKYLSGLPEKRRERINSICEAFQIAGKSCAETMKYRMPTFENGKNWVSVGNQKNYISVYFCSAALIENIRAKHPQINTGKGCVRIRDNQEIPFPDLVESFKKAMHFKS